MTRLLLAIAIALSVHGGIGAERLFAGCPGGQCKKPIRNAIAPIPTLAAPRRPHPIVVKPSEGQRSVVVRRGFSRRGPGLWARITFRPGR